MKIVDVRPTLASWPKKIYDWSELPEIFHQALSTWRALGMPSGNVTYIPRIQKGNSDEEYAIAWWNDQVIVQTLAYGNLKTVRIPYGHVRTLVYEHQLLKCKIFIPFKNGNTLEFNYQQVKEDLLHPVINLLLYHPAERPFPIDHPDRSMDWLLKESLMYHPSVLCYRFDDKILDSLWFKSSLRVLPFLVRRRPRPEYFFAVMDRGLVIIDRNFYRKRVYYFMWENIKSITIEPHLWSHGSGVKVTDKSDFTAIVPLLSNQVDMLNRFLTTLRSYCHIGTIVANRLSQDDSWS